MDPERKIKTTIYIPESVLWLLRERAVSERIPSDSAAFEAAIRAWHASTNIATQKALAFQIQETDNLELPESAKRLIRMLAALLSSGKPDAIRAVTENIEVFYKYACGTLQQTPPASEARTDEGNAGEHRQPGTDLPPGGASPSKGRRRK